RVMSLPKIVRNAGFPFRAPSVPLGVEPQPDPNPVGADYDTEWARTPAARAARSALVEGFMRPLTTVLGSPRLDGLDRLDGLEGPVVFAANHHSHFDTPLLLTSIPRPWRHKIVVGA